MTRIKEFILITPKREPMLVEAILDFEARSITAAHRALDRFIEYLMHSSEGL